MKILSRIQTHADLVALDANQRQQLCREIREFLVSSVAQTGGHLASNLGVVELTVAVETVFNTAHDRLVFDVGHQSYVHKLLTGRQADFSTLRQFGGMAGFPKPGESNTDAFVAGHASSSVSIALGMARARTLLGENYHIAALLGDGAATGGMVYEGLSDAAVSGEPMVLILNDNAMSIHSNVGGMAKHLARLRTKDSYLGMKARYRDLMRRFPGGKTLYRLTRRLKDRIRRALIPNTLFETIGWTYLGPVDGHDTESLIHLLTQARDMGRPVVVHVLTQKGRGYAPAEQEPSRFHGIGVFDPESGKSPASTGESFSSAFGRTLCQLAGEDKRLCAITAAMPGGTGLLDFRNQFPDRFFDVGIAEEHAVSMAGGMAKEGLIPVTAIYSTFLQRSYDMILQDIALLNLHTVLAVDRAGLVGEDGETHHGVFDVGFLRSVPGISLLCPASCEELSEMLRWAVRDQTGPVAIRYPRGGDRGFSESHWDGEKSFSLHRKGDHITLITYGTLISNVMEAAELLASQGIEVTVLRALRLTGWNPEELKSLLAPSHKIFVAEEVMRGTGIRGDIAAVVSDCTVFGADLGRNFVTHGNLKTLYAHYGLDPQSLCRKITEVLHLES